jgi:hypothetical protein
MWPHIHAVSRLEPCRTDVIKGEQGPIVRRPAAGNSRRTEKYRGRGRPSITRSMLVMLA